MLKILVLGGSGFIGSAICEELLFHKFNVRVLARPTSAPYRRFFSEEKMEWIIGDYFNMHDVRMSLSGIDVVIHCISTTLPKNANDDPLFDTQSNLIAFLRFLDISRKSSVKKIIFISSGGTVYGLPKYIPIDEMHPTDPITSYGITKLAMEKHLQLFGSITNISIIILRLSNPYGPRQRVESAQGAVGVFINKAQTGAPIEIWGDGQIVRDFVFVKDIANAVLSSIKYRGINRIFNVGSGVGTSINELIGVIEKVTSKRIKKIFKESRSFDVPANILDCSKAVDELLLPKPVALIDGIKETVEYGIK